MALERPSDEEGAWPRLFPLPGMLLLPQVLTASLRLLLPTLQVPPHPLPLQMSLF